MFGANILNDDGRLLLSSAADAFLGVEDGCVRAKQVASGTIYMDTGTRFSDYFSEVELPSYLFAVYVRVHPDVQRPPIVAFKARSSPRLDMARWVSRRTAKGSAPSSDVWYEGYSGNIDASVNCLGFERQTGVTLPSGLSWGSRSGGPSDDMYIFYFATFRVTNLMWRAFAYVPPTARDMTQTNGMEIYNASGSPTFTSRPDTRYYSPKVMQIEVAVKLNPPITVANDNSMSPIRGENKVSVSASGGRWMAFSGDGILTHKSGVVRYDRKVTTKTSTSCIGAGFLKKCWSSTTTTTTDYYFQSFGVYSAGVTPWVYKDGIVYYTPIPLRGGRALQSTKSSDTSGNSLTQFLSGAALNNLTTGMANYIVSRFTSPLNTYFSGISERIKTYNSVGKIPANHKEETRNDVLFILRD